MSADAESSPAIPAQVLNIREAYRRLEERVNRSPADPRRKCGVAWCTGVGGFGFLCGGRTGAANASPSPVFELTSPEQRHRFSPAEYNTLRGNVAHMQESLDRAAAESLDPPNDPTVTIPVVLRKVPNGKGTGRHRLAVSEQFLASTDGLTTNKRMAAAVGCSAKTLRRRKLEAGLAIPGAPVRREEAAEDGSTRTHWQSSTPAISAISDDPETLDALISDILQQFPQFGRDMLGGALSARGFRVPADRIDASYLRVRGVPRPFQQRRIERGVYSVPAVNSLWHHDGQHGLIRWKIVIHAFIDGKSRFVTGIRASSNNLAETVLEIFKEAVEKHDGRGSYIFGMSVHNIRIERLWVDWTRGVGRKWSTFFRTLELSCGLVVDNPAHLWLLHHLFLPLINADAVAWVEAWNAHKMTIEGEGRLSPRAMFTLGALKHGYRGIDVNAPVEQVGEEDLPGYGVDWREQDDPAIAAHHAANNAPLRNNASNPFSARIGEQKDQRPLMCHSRLVSTSMTLRPGMDDLDARLSAASVASSTLLTPLESSPTLADVAALVCNGARSLVLRVPASSPPSLPPLSPPPLSPPTTLARMVDAFCGHACLLLALVLSNLFRVPLRVFDAFYHPTDAFCLPYRRQQPIAR
ncbi:hypothetical protein MKEN_01116700 [Mycena kentingensis (nom. inval.)]|nr:hypothetical protein MKEN_01116700 [Mycena kentingensis (nom. inval.)]